MEKTKRIGFFSQSYAFNRHKRLQAYSMMFPEAEMVLFTTNLRDDADKWKGVKNLKVVVIPSGIKGYTKVISYCRRNKLDYLSNLGHRSSMPLLFLNRIFTGTEYISNRGVMKDNIWDSLIFYNFAKKIQVNDIELYEKMKKTKYGKKVHYVPAPTDTSFYIPKDKKAMRKKLGLPIKKDIVLFVGRVNEKKGSYFLYEAIKSNPDILFVVIGAMVDERFKDLKSSNYLYLGKKEGRELVEYYGAADLGFFIILIDGGGLAMTSHECLSCGRPIIISERKREDKDYEFILVAKENPSDVTKTLRNFFKSKRNEKKLEKECRAFATERCSIKKWGKEYRRLFLDEE